MKRCSGLLEGFPIIVYEHDADNSIHIPKKISNICRYIANSRTTAGRIRQLAARDSLIIPPVFGLKEYQHSKSIGKDVLFGSTSLKKGADIALKIAQSRPNYRFIFVKTWDNNKEIEKVAEMCLNIEVLENRQNLLDIFPRICLLLMPTRIAEAWGRTATEAQICGIPVLGSDRGNLPDTIGRGGLTLNPDIAFENWLAAFDQLMVKEHEEFAQLALERGLQVLHAHPSAYTMMITAVRHTLTTYQQQKNQGRRS